MVVFMVWCKKKKIFCLALYFIVNTSHLFYIAIEHYLEDKCIPSDILSDRFGHHVDSGVYKIDWFARNAALKSANPCPYTNLSKQ